MEYKPDYKKMQIINQVAVKSSNGVECKVELSNEEYKNVVSVSANTYLYFSECLNKEIKYSGKVVFTVIYKDGEILKKCETGAEFSYKFPCEYALQGGNLLGTVRAESCGINSLNGIVSASAVIVYEGTICKPFEEDLLVSCSPVITKNKEVNSSKLIGTAKKEFKVEEEFSLPMSVSNVLMHSETVVVNECQCGIGSVIIDGEIQLKTLVIPLDNQKEIKTENKIIPFRVENELENVMPTCVATGVISLKDVALKVFVDEGKNTSNVTCEFTLDSQNTVYENVSLGVIADCYSVENELKIEKVDKKFTQIINEKCLENSVKCEVEYKNIENGRLICAFNDKIEQTEITYQGSIMNVTGAVSLSLMTSNENDYFSQSVTVPFTSAFTVSGDKIICPVFTISNFAVKEINSNTAMVEFTLKACFAEEKSQIDSIICKIEEGEKKQVDDSAISVYIPSEGDTVWEVAKSLGVTEETVTGSNEDLTFPLGEDDRIVIYRETDK